MNEILEILYRLRTRGIVLSLDGVDGNVKARGNVKDLSVEDKVLLKERKNDIVLLLKQTREANFVKIEPLSSRQYYTLSSSQRRLWLLSQFEEAAEVYNIPISFVLEGVVDEQLFHRSFYLLITRHESLRTIFTKDGKGEPCQVILEPEQAGFTLCCIDLRHSGDAENEVKELMTRYNAQAFDLTTGPLMRVALVRIEEGKWILHCVLHHIVSDGLSMYRLVQELFRSYDACSRRILNPLSPLRIQYKDYAAWQQEQLEGGQFNEDKVYWLQQFEGELPVLELPGDRARPKVKTYNGALVESQLPLELGRALTALSQRQGGTLFMGLLAAVKALFYHYSGQADIIIGTPIEGREHAELEEHIGFFLNMLALRTRFNPRISFRQLLDQVKEVTLGAFVHQSYPFEELVDNLHLQRDRSRNPLFDVLVVLQNTGLHTAERQEAGGLKVSIHKGADVEVSKFDLTIAFVEAAESLQLSIEYNTDIYDKATIGRMAAHLERLIGAAVANPEGSVQQLDYLSEEEKHQLLVQFNDTAADYPVHKTIAGLFEEQAAAIPGKTAVLFEDKELTYKELNEVANQMAHYFRTANNLHPDDLVAVRLPRSEKLVVTLLAVLKSGAAYVPIDPEYPQEQIDYMINDSGCKLVVDEELLSRFLQKADEYSRENFTPSHLKPHHLAYTIYTSGSTGHPKGVMISHGNVVAFLSWCREEFRNSDFDTVFATTSVCFDLSIFEIFYTLSAGKQLRILPHGLAIPRYLHTSNKILVNTVPSVVGTLLSEGMDFSNVTVMNMAGEPIPARCIRQLDCERIEVRNLYGPSEDTTFSTMFRIKGEGPVLIGRPISNTQVYITGSGGQLVPAGVTGEICLSGAGLARGYLNKPELTAEKFIIQTFNGRKERIYKTGDWGKWTADGNLEFLGRKDTQVKVRGYRIELTGIESALESLKGIEAAVVLATITPTGEKVLVAYFIGNQAIDVQDLRSSLGKSLPAYMIPAWFVQLDKLPLTPNGKVNRKLLPEPEGLALSPATGYIAPRTETEEKLIVIWQDVLGRQKVGVKDDFFDLGGHSLKAFRLVNEIHRLFEVKLSLNTVFENPTPEEQAPIIEQGIKTGYVSIEMAPRQEYYPLSSAQRRIFFFQEFAPQSTSYNMPMVNYLGKEADPRRIAAVLHQLIARHESLRTSFEETDGLVMQKIHSEVAFEMDIHECLPHEFEGYWQSYVRPFDLAHVPLLRSSLVHIKEVGYAWIVDMHHIISDGTSHQVLADDFRRLYRGETLPGLRLQYRDFSHWQNSLQQSREVQKQKEYWLSQFSGSVPRLNLPTDRPRPSVFSFEGALHSFTLDKELTAQVRVFCKQQHGTLQMVLLSALNVLIHRYTDQQDIVIGCGIAGRRHPDLERIVGMFVNTLAIRNYPEANKTFGQFYKEVSASCLAAYENQDLQFDDLVDMLQVERDPSANPIFDVTLVVQNFAKPDTGKSALSEAEEKAAAPFTHQRHHRTSKFDMSWFVFEQEEDICIGLEYYSAIFDAATIERMAHHFKNVLREAVSSPSASLAEVRLLSVEERQLLLQQYVEGEQPEFAFKGSLHELFDRQSLLTPGNIALISGDESYTYKELGERSNQLAHFLMGTGLKKGDPVGVLQSRNKDQIVSLLAILKAGGVYVPLGSDNLEERLLYMLQDTAAEVLLTSSGLLELGNRLQLRGKGIKHLVCVDSTGINKGGMLGKDLTATEAFPAGSWMNSHTGEMEECLRNTATNGQTEFRGNALPGVDKQQSTQQRKMYQYDLRHIQAQDTATVNLKIDGTATAYIIYTSGSTGKPKGVMVSHRNIAAFFDKCHRQFGAGGPVTMPVLASNAFDISLFETFFPLFSGGTLVVLGSSQVKDTACLLNRLKSVTAFHAVPALMAQVTAYINESGLAEEYARITDVFTGGDAVPTKVLADMRTAFPQARIHVLYGPTESTIFVTSKLYNPEQENFRGPLVGRPDTHALVYIIDAHGQLAPIGMTGEICIGGDIVSKGYFNQPELTAEKFVENPFRKGKMVYKTGDLGRWLTNGGIEFLGRKDSQVKIRGYRIELAEIENALRTHASVQEAVVVKSARSEDNELVAYVVGKSALIAAGLRSYLGGLLPAYMVPAHFVQLDALPLNSNGKLDRKNLPEPQGFGMASGTPYVAPRTLTEEKLVQIWQELLGRERISVKDNFFGLGGHSLKATRLSSHIHKVFEVKVELKDLFSHSILEEQARLVGQASGMSYNAIPVAASQESYPLSSSQRRLWVLSRFGKANSAYNMPGAYVFEGQLDRMALGRSFHTLVGRHTILRTVFRENDEGEIRQFILPARETGFGISYHDLRNEQDREEKVKTQVQSAFAQPFDLAAGPLLKASLYQLEENLWVFAYVMHHIIGDGWSMNILIRELLQFYDAHKTGESAPLAPLRIQYKDFAAWQQQQLRNEELQAHKDYWLKQFEGEIPLLELPGDRVRPAVKTYNGKEVRLRLDAGLSQGIKDFSQQQGGTLFMGLLAAVKALLYRYTGQEDIIIGSPIAGREHADLEGQIGFYPNMLALRSRFSGNNNFHELFHHVKQVSLDAYGHQAYPFDELVDNLNLRRDMSRSALFDVMVGLQNNDSDGVNVLQNLDGLRVSAYGGAEAPMSKFDLEFAFTGVGDELELALSYNSDIYASSTIGRLGGHLQQLLSAIIREPQKPIQQLDYLGKEEKRQLLQEFNDTFADFPKDKTLPQLFEHQVAECPGRIALVFGETELTYKQVNEQANRLAHYLKATYNIQTEDRLAICLERGPWMIISALAVLKAGGAYIPIDIEYPGARIDHMLADSQSKALINNEELEKFWQEQDRYSKENPSPLDLQPSSLAHIIYTSGSTGKPKGVMVEHRSVVNLVLAQTKELGITPDENILQFSNFAFDASVEQMFLALASGARLTLIDKETQMTPERLEALIEAKGITYVNMVPGMLELLKAKKYSALKRMISGGDRCSQELAERWSRYHTFYNGYGPTEATVASTGLRYEGHHQSRSVPSIGRPLFNYQVYVLDGLLNPVPIGAAGEICIGGAGITRGYWNRPELTAEKFVPNPFKQGGRIYRTGDLGRWLEDGTIDFIGRKDEQVKVRGYRIELGEIESALQTHPGVESCVVVAKAGQQGGKELVAYVTGGKELDVTELRTWLRKNLPYFMIPSYYVRLDSLPLTLNGKVDRKSLPEPEGLAMSAGSVYMAPRNSTEKKLVAIWQEVLRKDTIGINDHFFDLGGNSIKVIRMIESLNKTFGKELSVIMGFKYPSIAELAEFLLSEDRHEGADLSEEDFKIALGTINDTLQIINR
jgi:tyrocidine synthetase-3